MGRPISDHYQEIWAADFEFSAQPGDRPKPICLVAHELVSGRSFRFFEEELNKLIAPPYPIGKESVFVAYYASAELTCHLALGWNMPENVLDLYTEFRNMTNGRNLPHGKGLLGAMSHFGLDCMGSVEKEEMRALILRGGPWSATERLAILDYCESDVKALRELLPRMAPRLDLPRALLRGRYMKAVSKIEHQGIPIDTKALNTLMQNWDGIKGRLVQELDRDYGVYEGLSFKQDRFEQFLIREKIPWPRSDTGKLKLDDKVFRQMAKAWPKISPLRELRSSLSQLRLADIAVGADGRNRTLLSPFQSRTGRNQPSNSKFIFGPSVWTRSLICPAPKNGIAYLDWSQQEFGIAAALSRDQNMIAAYVSGDPYLAFAKQAGAVPESATKKSHSFVREQFKQCVLAVQYGMGEESLAERIGQAPIVARNLLRMHRTTYPTFWTWSDAALDKTMLHGSLTTAFGWTIHAGTEVNPRAIRNFPMQANGAEMLRIACMMACERGIKICAPVHDALLVEAPLDELDDTIAAAKDAMSEASAIVLDGFRLNSDAKVFRFPERYRDERGKEMWNRVWELIGIPEYLIT